MCFLRVIAGKAKKFHLKGPKGTDTRPTADRVKESVFNILAPKIPGCSFLDLFSGSGGIAIEALSRGAEQAVLVEKDPRALAVIKENLIKTKLVDQAKIIGKDVFKALNLLAKQNISFDIIYIDPPYNSGYYLKVLEVIAQNALLASDGIVAAESGKKDMPPESVQGLSLFRRQTYGDTVISFYQKSL